MNKQKKISWKSMIRLIALCLCGGILGVNIYMANANGLMRDQLPMPLGFGGAVVLSGSMEPELSVGDLIIVTKADAYTTGDIVVFQERNSLVVHRIVDMNDKTVTTQGDANNTADKPIPISALKGKVRFWIPRVGDVIGFLKTPMGSIFLIAAVVALLELPRLAEKKKDEEKRQMLLAEIKRLKSEEQSDEKEE